VFKWKERLSNWSINQQKRKRKIALRRRPKGDKKIEEKDRFDGSKKIRAAVKPCRRNKLGSLNVKNGLPDETASASKGDGATSSTSQSRQ